MKKKFDLVVVGHLAYEDIKTPFDYKTVYGGAGHYVVIPASLYSKNIGLVSRVGRDYDLNFLKKLGIDFHGVKKLKDIPTAHFLVDYSKNLIDRDIEIELNACSDLVPSDIPLPYLNAQFIHIATNLPQTQKTFINFIRRKSSATLSIDTVEQYIQKWPELVAEVFSLADLIFINQEEHALIKLTQNKKMVIKKGVKGAEYIDGAVRIKVPAPKIKKVVDTTGSGDVLAGIFMVLLARGWNIREALKEAVRMASLSITDFGAEHLLLKYNQKIFGR